MPNNRDFSYSNRDLHVIFAGGALARLGAALEESFDAKRVMIVCTPGRTPVVEVVRRDLGARFVGMFDGARLHVPATVVAQALDVLQDRDPDCLVAIGGGSAIGLGKILAKESGIPLTAVPTTYSGSEMTEIWGMTDGDRKHTGRDPRVAPRLVLYDPNLTAEMPAETTAASGVNAIAHSVEALYSPLRSPVTSLLAADGIRRLAASLPVLVRRLSDGPARWNALCGAHLCGRALDMSSMGLHHKLCHVLGGTLGLPHALTHAIVLPYSTAFNAASAPNAMETIASALGAPNAPGGLWKLNNTLGITKTLADLGMRADHLDLVVAQVVDASYPNPTPVTTDGVRRLLERAMSGDPPE